VLLLGRLTALSGLVSSPLSWPVRRPPVFRGELQHTQTAGTGRWVHSTCNCTGRWRPTLGIAAWPERESPGLTGLVLSSTSSSSRFITGTVCGSRQQHWRRSAQPVSFFSPDSSADSRRISSWNTEDDDDDLFLPPPAPEPVREGELGGELPRTHEGDGRYGSAGGGRTEGWWAALQEDPDRLRASDLNELLQPDHLERLKFMNFPMQAYGAIFKLEVLLSDGLEVHRRPWQLVAEEQGLRLPDDDELARAIGMRPERAIQQTFRWTDDWGETQKLAFEHYHAKQSVHREMDFEAADGALEWLKLLNEYHVPCCVCAGTSLDRGAAERALERAGLHELCAHYVTAEDGCETAEQSYLVACIKVQRPPERCVVFGDDVDDVLAGHDATSKVVAVLDPARQNGADLRIADQRVSSLDELSLMSLRELFQGEKMR